MVGINFFIPQVVSMEDTYAKEIQLKLLKIILLTTCMIAAFSVVMSLLDILPFSTFYTFILAGYTAINLWGYYYLNHNETAYTFVVNLVIFSSLFTFSIMSVEVYYDALRMLWFFLLSFAAYVLGGKWYGVRIAFMIVSIVALLGLNVELYLSKYEFSSFFSSFIAFNAFMLYFLSKIHLDVQALQTRIEQEVQKRQTQEQILLRKHRMTNMGEMIDAIAHQWRQPLSQANMILLNMEEELDDKVYLEKKITQLSTLNTHMSQTIEDFRHLLHDSEIKISFSLKECIDEVLTLMKNQLHEVNIIFSNYTVDEVENYKNEFIQVLIILLSNAIEVLHENRINDKKIIIDILEVQHLLYITIEDNGGGIKPYDLEKLFDAYFTTRKSNGGTGLGLYIAKIIVEDMMQGELSVCNTTQGAKFTIVLKRML